MRRHKAIGRLGGCGLLTLLLVTVASVPPAAARHTGDTATRGSVLHYETTISHTCSAHACVHWVETGEDAPPLDDLDADGIPDWPQAYLAAVEKAWTTFVGEWGFKAPLPDTTSENYGPDGRLDVYVADVDGSHGFVLSDAPARNAGALQVSAYIVVDNDHSGIDAAERPEVIRHVAAHELFHAIQFAYDFMEDGWMKESSAEWATFMLRGVPIRAGYCSTAFPHIPLDSYDCLEGYGSLLIWEYASRVFTAKGAVDANALREIWELADASEGALNYYSVEALSQWATSNGLDFNSFFSSFGLENAYPSRFYPGFERCQLTETRSVRLSATQRSVTQELAVDHLVNDYTAFWGGALEVPSALEISVDLPDRSDFVSAAVLWREHSNTQCHDEVEVERQKIALDDNGIGHVTIPDFPRKAVQATLVLTNASIRYTDCFPERTEPGEDRYSCRGLPVDDDLPMRFTASLVPMPRGSTTSYSRSVTLELHDHLTASGLIRVDGTERRCYPPRFHVQRKTSPGWTTVKKVEYGSSVGLYRVSLKDRVGRYRVVLPRIVDNDGVYTTICKRAVSNVQRHPHR